MALLVLAGGGLWLMTQPEPWRSVPDLSGRAQVVDGDTIRLAGTRVRLMGLDAPEIAQTCRDAAGADWPCGGAAFGRMAQLVGDAAVTCRAEGHDKYGRTLAHCAVNGADLGATLVADGLAVASGDYLGEEAAARAGRRGIWAGSFERPADWREGARVDGFWAWLSGLFG